MGILLLGSAPVVVGKMQAGVSSMFGSIDIPFIDVCRIVGSTWQAFLAPTQDSYQFLNADGYPNAMPSGAFEYRALLDALLQDPADGFSGNWILDWTGGPATLDAVFTGTNVTQGTVSSTITGSSGRIVFNVVSSTLAPYSAMTAQINISAVTGQITKVRLYPARYETRLNGGNQWDPDFINFYKVYGRVRFMDWSRTNSNPQVRWEHRTLPTQFSQRGFNITAPYYCGQCTQVKNDYTTLNAIPASPSVSTWTDGLMVQAVIVASPVEVNVQSITLGATTTINATAHGFVNGDLVQFSNSTGGGNGGTLGTSIQLASLCPVFTVAGATANTFNLSGINSSTWNGTSGGTVYYQIRVKAGLLPIKTVSGMDGNTLFSGVMRANSPIRLVYDADFDRLMYSQAPDGTGNALENGVAIETLVDLANNLGPLVQPWFCLPHGVDSTYVTNWATYIRDNLNPGIKFCVELSNEVWNSAAGFIQTSNYANKGSVKWSQAASAETQYQYYGFRFGQVMSIIETVFSGQMSRVNRCFGMHANDPPTFSTVIHRAECPLGGFTVGNFPINHADSLHIANYYNMTDVNPVDYTAIFNVLYSGNPSLVTTGLNYFDNRFRTDSSGASLTFYAGVSQPPFTNVTGQWFLWGQFCAGYTSALSSLPIKFTAYEGGFNGFSLYGFTGTPYSPPITISSGTYNSSTGETRLTTTPTMSQAANGQSLTISALTGTGSVSSLNGTYGIANDQHAPVVDPSTGTIVVNGTPGLGAVTITGGALINLTADQLGAIFNYQNSSVYATFLTDASNGFVAAGANFPSQFCVVAGAWSRLSPFSLKQPNRLAADTPPYLAWRTLNGR